MRSVQQDEVIVRRRRFGTQLSPVSEKGRNNRRTERSVAVLLLILKACAI